MNDLKNQFTQSNEPRIFQLHKNISNLMQNQLSMNAYYTKLKSYWNEYMKYSAIPPCTYGLPPCTCSSTKHFYVFTRERMYYAFSYGIE